jgi:hypothetical protein
VFMNVNSCMCASKRAVERARSERRPGAGGWGWEVVACSFELELEEVEEEEGGAVVVEVVVGA